jgi:hypothetical protein
MSKERLILLVLAGITVGALCLMYMIGPILDENKELNSKIHNAQRMLARHKVLLKEKEKIRASYAQFFSARKRRFGNDPSISMLQKLEETAQSAGIKIIDMRQSTLSLTEGVEVIVAIRAEAKEKDLLAFIYRLKGSDLYFTIKKLDLRPTGNIKILDARFEISSFMFQ